VVPVVVPACLSLFHFKLPVVVPVEAAPSSHMCLKLFLTSVVDYPLKALLFQVSILSILIILHCFYEWNVGMLFVMTDILDI